MFGLSLFPGTTRAASGHTVAAVGGATVALVEPEVQMNFAALCDAILCVALRLAHER